jgi:hypothetical protein
MPLYHPFARHLNKFAYRHGTSIELLRRVGAIYLRDIAIVPELTMLVSTGRNNEREVISVTVANLILLLDMHVD